MLICPDGIDSCTLVMELSRPFDCLVFELGVVLGIRKVLETPMTQPYRQGTLDWRFSIYAKDVQAVWAVHQFVIRLPLNNNIQPPKEKSCRVALSTNYTSKILAYLPPNLFVFTYCVVVCK